MDSFYHQAHPGLTFSFVGWALIAGLTIFYLGSVYAQHTDHKWNRWRIIFFLLSAVFLGVAVSPQLVNWAHHDLRGHMVQHLLIGMMAPLGLVLAAPMMLALRTMPVSAARRVTSILRSRPIHLLAHPVTAFMLNIGGMYVLYMTPLYAATLDAPVLHHLVHVHFFLAGYLFCWAILAGPDPAPRPTVMRFRLAVLFISIAAHAILGKLMYGYLLPRNTLHSVEEIQAAAQIIYYGGDFAELLLVIALFGMWYNKRTSRRYAFFSVS